MNNRITFSTPTQSSPELQTVPAPPTNTIYLQYVGFWRRFAAQWIDLFIIYIATLPILLLVVNAIVDYEPITKPPAIIIFLVQYYIVIAPVILFWIYSVVTTYLFQTTLGKKVFGIKVVQSNGERLSLLRIIFRETIGKLISFIVLFIGYIMIALTNKKQSLHDYIIGSVVVYKDPTKKKSVVMVTIISIFGLLAVAYIAMALYVSSISYFANKPKSPSSYANIQEFGTITKESLNENSENTTTHTEIINSATDFENALITRNDPVANDALFKVAVTDKVMESIICCDGYGSLSNSSCQFQKSKSISSITITKDCTPNGEFSINILPVENIPMSCTAGTATHSGAKFEGCN